MQLFKYCRSAHMHLALERGAVRIGTLFGYRCTDKYGEMTSDPLEGFKLMGGVVEGLTAQTRSLYPALAGLVSVEDGGSVGRIEIGEARIQSPDLLVFSASLEYSESLHKLWLREEGYDACYTITSSKLFFRAISEAIGPRYTFRGVHRVTYSDKLDIATAQAGVHPAVVKRMTGFADQAEVRALWTVDDKDKLEPLTLDRSSACRYAKLHRALPAAA